MVEHRAFNPYDVGSNPIKSSIMATGEIVSQFSDTEQSKGQNLGRQPYAALAQLARAPLL